MRPQRSQRVVDLVRALLCLVPVVASACRLGYEELAVPGGGAGSLANGGASGSTGSGASGGTDAAAGEPAQGGAASLPDGGDAGTTAAGTSSGGNGGVSGAGGNAGNANTSGSGGSDAGSGGSSAGTSGSGGSSAGSAGTSAGSGGSSAGNGGTGGSSGGSGGSGGVPGCTDTVDCTCAAFQGHSYSFCTPTLTYNASTVQCATQGMHLVRIDSGGENAFILSTGTSTGVFTFNGFTQIGADDLAVAGEWRWTDGTQFWQGGSTGMAVGGLYQAWDNASPTATGTKNCSGMLNTGLWQNRSCTAVSTYVCESP